MNGDYVLVVGSAVLEISGKTIDILRPGMHQYGHIHASVSGVARNIAENLARLDIDTVLLSAIANDDIGQHLITHSTLAGIDCRHVLRVSGAHTATSMLLYHSEDNCTRVDDLSIAGSLDSDYLLEHEWLFENAALVVIDATLSEEALDTLFELAMRHQVRVCADPTSPLMASRLRRFIANLCLIVPNASETAALCSLDEPATERESAIGTAQQLVNMGADIAVVTLGEQGLAYADSSGGGYIRAIHTEVVDTAGAGDAFSGAVIFGILNDVPIDEAMRLGVTAASLTLESEDTVLQSLNQELLYDELSA
jgi:pseudouridine kinase